MADNDKTVTSVIDADIPATAKIKELGDVSAQAAVKVDSLGDVIAEAESKAGQTAGMKAQAEAHKMVGAAAEEAAKRTRTATQAAQQQATEATAQVARMSEIYKKAFVPTRSDRDLGTSLPAFKELTDLRRSLASIARDGTVSEDEFGRAAERAAARYEKGAEVMKRAGLSHMDLAKMTAESRSKLIEAAEAIDMESRALEKSSAQRQKFLAEVQQEVAAREKAAAATRAQAEQAQQAFARGTGQDKAPRLLFGDRDQYVADIEAAIQARDAAVTAAAGKSQANIAKLLGIQEFYALSAEVEADYAKFWQGIVDSQDRAAAQAATQSQANINALLGVKEFYALSAEVEGDYAKFWQGIVDSQDRAAAQAATQSQANINRLLGVREFYKIAPEVEADYVSLWQRLGDAQDKAVAASAADAQRDINALLGVKEFKEASRQQEIEYADHWARMLKQREGGGGNGNFGPSAEYLGQSRLASLSPDYAKDQRMTALSQERVATEKALADAIASGAIPAAKAGEVQKQLAEHYAKAEEKAAKMNGTIHLSNNAYLQLTASARNTFDSLAAGLPISQIMITQGAQVVSALASEGAVMRALISPTGAATAALLAFAAASALVLIRVNDISSRTREMESTFRVMGRASGESAAQMFQFAKAMEAAGAGRGESLDAIQGLLKNSQFGADMVGRLGRLSVDYSTQFKGDTVKAAEDLVKKMGDLSGAAEDVARTYRGSLSPEQVEMIKRLEAQGRAAEAADMLLGALEKRMGGELKRSTTDLAHSLKDLAEGWNSLMDALANSDGVKSAVDVLAGLANASAALMGSEAGRLALMEQANKAMERRAQALPEGAERTSLLEHVAKRRAANQPAGVTAPVGGEGATGASAAGDLLDRAAIEARLPRIKNAYRELEAQQKATADEASFLANAISLGIVKYEDIADVIDKVNEKYRNLLTPMERIRKEADLAREGAQVPQYLREAEQARIQAREAAKATDPGGADDAGKEAYNAVLERQAVALRDLKEANDAASESERQVAIAAGKSAEAYLEARANAVYMTTAVTKGYAEAEEARRRFLDSEGNKQFEGLNKGALDSEQALRDATELAEAMRSQSDALEGLILRQAEDKAVRENAAAAMMDEAAVRKAATDRILNEAEAYDVLAGARAAVQARADSKVADARFAATKDISLTDNEVRSRVAIAEADARLQTILDDGTSTFQQRTDALLEHERALRQVAQSTNDNIDAQARQNQLRLSPEQARDNRAREINQQQATGILSADNARLLLQEADREFEDSTIRRLDLENDFVSGAERSMRRYVQSVGSAADQTERLMTNAFKGMEDALVDFAMTGKFNFADLANSIIRDMIRMQIQASITVPLMGALNAAGGLGGIFSSLFGGGGGNPVNTDATTTWVSPEPVTVSPLANAHGNAFVNDNVIPFANGGTFTNNVVSNPTLFKFAQGAKLGLMGEAGPEAIVPLTRGPNGDLGVQAFGGGGGASMAETPRISVEINNYGSSKDFEVEQDFSGLVPIVRVIARDEANKRVESFAQNEMPKSLRGEYKINRPPVARG